MAHEPIDQQLEIEAHAGHVLVEGPVGVALTLSPKTAMDVGDKLLDVAAEARRQAVMAEIGRQGPDS